MASEEENEETFQGKCINLFKQKKQAKVYVL